MSLKKELAKVIQFADELARRNKKNRGIQSYKEETRRVTSGGAQVIALHPNKSLGRSTGQNAPVAADSSEVDLAELLMSKKAA